MVSITGAQREALEHFASRVIAEHTSNEYALCRSCHLFAPCPVEVAAIQAGLVEGKQLQLVDDMEWRVRESIDHEVVCETDWRRYGQGHIVIFELQAVMEGRAPDPMPHMPHARDAWNAARRWAQMQKVDDGTR